MNKLSNLPPKGTSDWMPEEFRIRKYIFDTWRKVCLSFGYEEYLTPLVEYAEVYRAKSGEDVGGRELTTFMDRGERELAIRPEMTPSVTRMVSRVYGNFPKPIRLFSIANFMRNEKPQKGRNREFWQLNVDIFGSDSVAADVETIQIALEIMKMFGANKDQFELRINDRNETRASVLKELKISEEKLIPTIRVIDNYSKMENKDFREKLISTTGSEPYIVNKYVDSFPEVNLTSLNIGSNSESRLSKVVNSLTDKGYQDYIRYDKSLVRGFDYYDGVVFEVYDKNPENKRAMFGGGRYNGLASIFGSDSFPAVGFAPGDETTKIFLENWNLVPSELREPVYYLPILSGQLSTKASNLAARLRSEGKNVILGLEEQKLGKSLDYANKTGVKFVVLFGEEEESRGEYVVKDMTSGEQKVFRI